MADTAMAITADDLPSEIVPPQTASPVVAGLDGNVPDSSESAATDLAAEPAAEQAADESSERKRKAAATPSEASSEAGSKGQEDAKRALATTECRNYGLPHQVAKADAANASPNVSRSGRIQKKVETFVGDDFREKRPVEIPEGTGVPLGEIPAIADEIDKGNGASDVFRQLHQLLYKAPGEKLKRKAHIRLFRGFVYTDKDTEKEQQAQKLKGLTVAELKEMCGLLHVERSGEKEAIIDRLLTFLEKPSKSGATAGALVHRKKSKTRRTSKGGAASKSQTPTKGAKSGKAAKAKAGKAGKTPSPNKKRASGKGAKASSDELFDDEDEDDSDTAGVSVAVSPVKKTTKPKAAPSPTKVNSPVKKPSAAAARAPRRIADSDDDDDDDVPLAAQFGKSAPTDADLERQIGVIIASSDLGTITNNQVLAQLSDHFKTNLETRKADIKSMIRKALTQSS